MGPSIDLDSLERTVSNAKPTAKICLKCHIERQTKRFPHVNGTHVICGGRTRRVGAAAAVFKCFPGMIRSAGRCTPFNAVSSLTWALVDVLMRFSAFFSGSNGDDDDGRCRVASNGALFVAGRKGDSVRAATCLAEV